MSHKLPMLFKLKKNLNNKKYVHLKIILGKCEALLQSPGYTLMSPY